ncbi:MAG TPA: hypothetical protein VER76_11990 [Pyrinomonadaceae bacterium]|nr:hypothetical protein [Pyrinomonadaceae bacterium]
MSDGRFTATKFKSETQDEAARRAAQKPGEAVQAAGRQTTRRTVGVYERPARRAKLSLPVIVIMVLATLISLVLSVRFLF